MDCAVSASNTPVQVSTGYSVVFWLASKQALFPKNCIQEFLGWIPVKPMSFQTTSATGKRFYSHPRLSKSV